MAILCVNWETAHLHGESWISHHRLRHRIFIERQSWTVPSYHGLEYDQFDTPAAKYLLWLDAEGHARGVTRLIPTTERYMAQSLWPDLSSKPLPSLASIWEASRFGCDHTVKPVLRQRIVAELICGCLEFGIEFGIDRYLSIMPLAIFKSVIGAAGCEVEMLGPARPLGRHMIGAAYIHVSAESLQRVRVRRGIFNSVLLPGLRQPSTPMSSPAAQAPDHEASRMEHA